MDFILLYITNKICGYAATYLRILLSATFGALWAVLVLISQDCVKIIFQICSYLPVSYICVWIISGKNHIKYNIRGQAALYAAAFVLYGAFNMLVMSTGVGSAVAVRILSRPAVLVCLIFSIIIVEVCLNTLLGCLRLKNYLAVVEICAAGKTFVAKALIDTGNHLSDPYTGKPVCVMDRRALPLDIDIGEDELMRYIPISSVGCQNGVIQIFTAKQCRIYNKDVDLELNDVLIGISENVISSVGEYDMLINPMLLK